MCASLIFVFSYRQLVGRAATRSSWSERFKVQISEPQTFRSRLNTVLPTAPEVKSDTMLPTAFQCYDATSKGAIGVARRGAQGARAPPN